MTTFPRALAVSSVVDETILVGPCGFLGVNELSEAYVFARETTLKRLFSTRTNLYAKGEARGIAYEDLFDPIEGLAKSDKIHMRFDNTIE